MTINEDEIVMDYQKIYNQLIQKRLTDSLSKKDCYCERHHIIPRSEGGSDDDDNKVNLTAREHYIAHLLLAKIYNDYKMWHAWNMMFCKNSSQKRNFKYNNRIYGKLKEEFRKKNSEYNKLNPKKPMLGKHHSEESKQKISMSKRGKKINVSSDDRDRRKKQITAYNKERDISGKNNPMYGHSCTDFMTYDEIAKWKSNIGKSVSKRLLGKKHSDAHKLINSLSHQGKLLWNNGKDYRHSKECPGPEWKRGRIKKKNAGK